MNKFIRKTKDILSNDYLIIDYNKHEKIISDSLSILKKILTDENDYNLYTHNQEIRDNRINHSHHMTILSVMEINSLIKKHTEYTLPFKRVDDIKYLGVGKVVDEKRDNTTFFIVCESEFINNLREELGLPKKDLHITLGFNKKDVFNKSKSIDSIIYNF